MKLRDIGHDLLCHVYPTKKNGFIPHVLKDAGIWVIFILGIGVFSLASIAKRTDSFGLLAEVYPSVIVSLTNEDRADASLQPLAISQTLTQAAQLKANDMAKHGYFAHTSPQGITPWHWFGQVGYKFIHAGENLAVNFDDSNTVQTAWLNSPTHRANIMSGNFTEIGIAIAKGFYNGKETTFVVEMFGMPATTRAAVAPTSPVASTPPTPQTPTPAPVTTQPTQPVPATTVAGESVETSEENLVVVKEDLSAADNNATTFIAVENTDAMLVPAQIEPTQTVKVPWYKRFLLNSSSVAGTVITLLIIVLFFATAAMVAREYEKHHIKHMVYGSFMMVILLSCLFVGKLGVFKGKNSVAYRVTPVQITP